MTAPAWKPHIDLYPDQVVVIFKTDNDFDRALRSFRNPSSALFGLPRDIVGDATYVIPRQALAYLIKEGIKYKTEELYAGNDRSKATRRKVKGKGKRRNQRRSG